MGRHPDRDDLHPAIGDWKEEYNHDRPSLGYRTLRAYAAICTH
jgi:hypothetical protein